MTRVKSSVPHCRKLKKKTNQNIEVMKTNLDRSLFEIKQKSIFSIVKRNSKYLKAIKNSSLTINNEGGWARVL